MTNQNQNPQTAEIISQILNFNLKREKRNLNEQLLHRENLTQNLKETEEYITTLKQTILAIDVTLTQLNLTQDKIKDEKTQNSTTPALKF